MGRRERPDPGRPLGAFAARSRAGRWSQSLSLRPAPGRRRRAPRNDARAAGDDDRGGRRRLRRTGQWIAGAALPRLADHHGLSERRRSRRRARRDRLRTGSRRPPGGLQSTAKGISRTSRGTEAAARRGARRRRFRRRRSRRTANRRRPPAGEDATGGGSLQRLRQCRFRFRSPRPPARGDPRQHGNVALGAAGHGQTADRGQCGGLFGLAVGRRHAPAPRARHRRQARYADARFSRMSCATF